MCPGPIPFGGRQRLEHLEARCADRREDGQRGRDRAVVVEAPRELRLVVALDRRPVLRDQPAEADVRRRLAVGKVMDDLPGRPGSVGRRPVELGGRDAIEGRDDRSHAAAEPFEVGGAIHAGHDGTPGPGSGSLQLTDEAVDPKRAERFYGAIRRYWPGLQDGSLTPGYSGIRPKTAGAGEPAPDFQIQGPRQHGIAGLVHLFGIESPGLTASLALADMVAREVS